MLIDFLLEELKKRPKTAKELAFVFKTQEFAVIEALENLIPHKIVDKKELSDRTYYMLHKEDKTDDSSSGSGSFGNMTLEPNSDLFLASSTGLNITKFRESRSEDDGSSSKDGIGFEDWAKIVDPKEMLEEPPKIKIKRRMK